MKKAVFLNSAKLDFDNNLDFTPMNEITEYSSFDATGENDILSRIAGMDIVITKEMPVPGHIIEKFPDSVKLLCEAGTGFNNIDIAAARKKNIAVCNVPTYSTDAVATMAITFVLNFSSSLIKQQIMLHEKNFDNFTKYLQVPHFEITGKTYGSIGGGAIASSAMKIARALGMNVLYFDPAPKDFDDPGIKSDTFENVLKNSDFVSIHCPLNANTKHLIDKSAIELMKKTAFLINTSRGPIIKEADLIEALNNNIIAGAGLDVQEVEPPSPDNPLFTMENVIMTPHIGWRRIESRQRLVSLTAENIKSFIDGTPVNVVN